VGERGDIILGWLVKLVVSLAIVGVAAFEAGAVVVARVGADSAANDAANEAAFVYARGANVDAAKTAAAEEASRVDARLVDFSVDNEGRAVVVTIAKRAKTLFLHRIGATRSWSEARSTRRRPVVTS
jgi:hypothetical protein